MTTTISLAVEERVEWWRPLVHWLLCLPHLAWNGVLTGASLLAHLAAVPVVLATGRVPRVLVDFQVFVLRERARTFAYFFVLRRSKPPYATEVTSIDPGDDPMLVLTVEVPLSTSRWAPIVRPFIVLPHVLVLLPIGACLDALYPLWMVLVAVNRGWPPGMARTLAAVERWVVEVILYVTMASNTRPAFGLAAQRAPLPA
jgi:hypothetical protein